MYDALKKRDEAIDKLNHIVNEQGIRDFYIYPFGLSGQVIKSLLNIYFGITELGIIDNGLAGKYSSVMSLDELSAKDMSDAYVLITNHYGGVYRELREQLYNYVSPDRCIDLYPDDMRKNKEQQQQISKRRKMVINKVRQNDMMKNGMVYHPIRTKSSFYLPYVFTDLIQQSILVEDDYFERGLLDRVMNEYLDGAVGRAVSRTDTVVLDIGANIGNHTLFFANEVGAPKVISFEPIDETFDILRENIQINGLDERVVLYKNGVSEHRGSAGIYDWSYDNIGGTALDDNGSDGDIELVVLDELDIKDTISLIKIDVEGMELRVLRGGAETISRSKPYIMAESFPGNANRVKKFMDDLDYDYIQTGYADWLFYPRRMK